MSIKESIRSLVKNTPILGNCCNKKEDSIEQTIDLSLDQVEEPYSLLGQIEDTIEVKTEERDWRHYFSSKLHGDGLEIGPLHRPMITHPGMKMKYVDRCTVADLREHYPELNELPLVEPDILDDAETLTSVSAEQFDFLISAHVIEHMKNPLSALEQWCRVLKPGGKIYMIVPDKRITFDKRRVRTSTAHIVLDYQSPNNDRDFEHFLDYAVHVHNKYEPSEALVEARRLLDADYSIHFHVFIPEDIVALLNWFSDNVRPIKILEGPCRYPGSDEFHFLLEVSPVQ